LPLQLLDLDLRCAGHEGEVIVLPPSSVATLLPNTDVAKLDRVGIGFCYLLRSIAFTRPSRTRRK
jgi:hypothetical protein